MVTTKYVSSWNYSGKYQKWCEEEKKTDVQPIVLLTKIWLSISITLFGILFQYKVLKWCVYGFSSLQLSQTIKKMVWKEAQANFISNGIAFPIHVLMTLILMLLLLYISLDIWAHSEPYLKRIPLHLLDDN